MVTNDEPPATSRSEEISTRSIRERRTTREHVDETIRSVTGWIDDLDQDPEASLEAKLAAVRTLNGSLRLLAKLTGEAGASDAQLAASPFYRRVRTAIVDALRPFPEAARAVVDALERAERGAPADLEAAAE